MKGIFGNKKILAVFLVLLVIVFGTVIALRSRRQVPPAGVELVLNGDCEEDGEGWLTDAWEKSKGFTDFAWTGEGEGYDGGRALHIVNHYANDARFWQDISVAPDCLYRISARVRAACSEGRGANVSVEGVYAFSNCLYDTAGEWEEAVLYARTGPEQTKFRLFVRLGGYSGEAQGEAYFDDISVTRIEAAPAGAAVQDIFSVKTPDDSEKSAPGTASAVILLSCFGYALLSALLIGIYGRLKAKAAADLKPRTGWAVFAFLALIALAVRFACAVTVLGYDVDINDFRIWADIAGREGPWGFYQASGFCDYPPGYILVLTLVGLFGKLTGGTTVLMAKMPAILADIATAAVLFRTAFRRTKDTGKALALSAMYLFNPLTVLVGSAWGQCDSVMTLFLTLTVIFALSGRWRLALPSYAAAVMLKPQALLFGPLGLLALVMAWVDALRRRRAGKKDNLKKEILPGLGLMLGVFLLTILPFAVGRGGVKWVFDLYGSTMGSYSYATVNSCNLYFLLGLNWAGTDTVLGWGASAAAAALILVPMAWVFYTANGRQGKAAAASLGLAPLMVFLILRLAGLDTCGYVGAVIIAVALLAAGAFLSMSGSLRHLPLCGAASLLMIFAGGAMMHERYLFPAAALLLLAYIHEKDKRILLLLITVTAAGVLNCGAVLDRNIRIGGSAGHLTAPLFGIVSDMGVCEYLSAALTVLSAAALTALAGERCLCPERLMALKADAGAAGPEETPPKELWRARAAGADAVGKGFFTPRDILIVSIVSVLFAVLTFTDLGSTKAPQRGFSFLEEGETAVLDLGEEKDFRLLYYQGIHYANSGFTVETAGDDGRFGGASSAPVNYGDCFKWSYVKEPGKGDTPTEFTGRYIRVTADAPGVTLFEVLARSADGEVYPMTLSNGSDGAEKLCDEPDTLEGEPGWYNSAYFDEIYHARTGYEILKGDMPIYEWTHPPLGKLLIALSVSVFGMTPFGWRFAGAFMGVAMLPAVYLIALMLTRKRSLALGAAGLMFFDFMHFTQTRIATIDSFVVCFILWSVFFMLWWFKLDYWRAPVSKSLALLGLSGLFMGLAIASKWTGCYCGVGLAVIFFWGVYRRYAEARGARAALDAAEAAKAQRSGKKERKERAEEPAPGEEDLIGRNGHRRIILDILSCFLFFIFIPLAIYYVSYIPVMHYEGAISVSRIVEECRRMLNYHSQPGLGMDHPFYSPWYEWPVIAKPMWFASGHYLEPGTGLSITTFGNPAVWYLGSASVLIECGYLVFAWIRGRREDMTVPALILICFLAQFLPWVLVPRGTYIYHYFASVPFAVMANVHLWGLMEKRKPRWGVAALAAQVALAVLLFVAFFPYISGVPAPVEWMEAMQWFPNWLWFSRG